MAWPPRREARLSDSRGLQSADSPESAHGRRAIRVAALIDARQVSGPGRQLAALAGCLASKGVEMLIVTFHRVGRTRAPFVDYLERAGVQHTVIPESGPLDWRLILRLRRVLVHWRPDIVQTHGYKPTVLAYALRRSGARWPWIAFFHGATYENAKVRLYNWLDDRLLPGADRVIVMSRRHLDRLARLRGKTRVVHNAAIALPEAELGSKALPTFDTSLAGARRPRIGVVGRLSPEKGVDVFLRACRELTQRGVAFSAIVAGDGPERGELQTLRDELGLRECVDFVGATSAVQSLYASLELLVIPSRSEGLPNVLLEALRADLPVVGTDVGAIPEVLDSPLAGTVVPSESPAALADAIIRALPLKDETAARSARRAVVERFSIERRASEHLSLYGDVLTSQGSGALPPAHASAKP
ncbi:MAG TPA: glycosyltransferase family 4 protein [Candidatus Limnocylindria bacterium]|nr:glycosyltransferase family 4 protein [Candidatus Limnocylindria bacterium]